MDMKSRKAKNYLGLYLRVLGYKESNGDWAAHCLETDLVGYGKSFNKALHNLVELTEMQIGFAQFKKQSALLDRPAPTEIIETYNSLMRQSLQSFAKRGLFDRKRKITSIPMPSDLSGTDYNFVSA
jgi:hypothetical protein